MAFITLVVNFEWLGTTAGGSDGGEEGDSSVPVVVDHEAP